MPRRGLLARGAHPPGREAIDALVRAHRAARPKADLAMLERAYEVAELLHREQRRRSGEPFITHPLAVAAILADLGVDTTTLVAALLHDTVEDTVYTLERARADFGEEVAHTGHRCVGARVNGQLVPLASMLSDGDVVEVLTTASEGAGPSRDWLEFVKTPQAQLGVRQWFAEQRRQLAIAAGRKAVGWALREASRDLDAALEDGSLARTAGELRYASLDDLFEAVGETLASPAWVVHQLLSAPEPD